MKYFQFITIGLLGISFTACAVQNQGNYLSQYQRAVAYYEEKKYYESLQIFEELIPLLKGRKEIATAQLYQAYAYFYEKNYKKSAYCFETFYKTYPRINQAEEALYMQGHSLYLMVPDICLDQNITEKAQRVLKLYLVQYPHGTYREVVQKYHNELEQHLMRKDFENAKLYEQLGHYHAAIIGLKNFQTHYQESIYQEEALFLQTKAYYQWAINSKKEEQQQRLQEMITCYHAFVDQFPNSQWLKTLEITRDFSALTTPTGNVYEAVAIISKRARQVAIHMKEDLESKLADFAVDDMDDVQTEERATNQEQEEITRLYEKLPKPTTIATEEFLEDKLMYRYNEIASTN
eukprot:gene148-200_t